MSRLEPLKFKPHLFEKIWGTGNLAPILGHTERQIGEGWCTYDESLVAEGPCAGQKLGDLLTEFGQRLTGSGWSHPEKELLQSSSLSTGNYSGLFPILSKLLFVQNKLSIQVHPDDAHAARLQGCIGKTELWYIVAAKENSQLGLGILEDISHGQFVDAVNKGDVESLIRWVPARQGDCVLVPAGTVHSIGGGVLLCEIQQNCDLTYRLYDYNRDGSNGKPRQLHTKQALEVMDTTSRPQPCRPKPLFKGNCTISLLGQCPYFTAELLEWNGRIDYSVDTQRCHILIIIKGSGTLNSLAFETGDTFVIPAESAEFPLIGNQVQAVRASLP